MRNEDRVAPLAGDERVVSRHRGATMVVGHRHHQKNGRGGDLWLPKRHLERRLHRTTIPKTDIHEATDLLRSPCDVKAYFRDGRLNYCCKDGAMEERKGNSSVAHVGEIFEETAAAPSLCRSKGTGDQVPIHLIELATSAGL